MQVRYCSHWNESNICYQESQKYPQELTPLKFGEYDRAYLTKRLIVTDPLRGWALIEEESDLLWVTHIARFKDATESGIGSLLIRAIQAEAERKEKSIILLGVNTLNSNARAFYDRQGFHEFGQIDTEHGTFLILGKGTIYGGNTWQNIGLNFMERLT